MRTETLRGARKAGAAAQIRYPFARCVRECPKLERAPPRAPLLARAAALALLPPADRVLGLTRCEQRANFCPAAGKRKTKTRHPHHFESLVTFDQKNINKRVVIPLCTWESRQMPGWNMHTGGTHKTLKIRGYKCTAESKVSEIFSENAKRKSGRKADLPSGNSAFLSHKTLCFLRLEKLSTMLRTICFYF